VQNRRTSQIQVNSGFFYDRTYYKDGARSIAEGTTEFVYTDPNPDTILREPITKVTPINTLQDAYNEMGVSSYLTKAGYTMRVMGTQVTTPVYSDAIAKATLQKLIASGVDPDVAAIKADQMISGISKFLTGYISADGTRHGGAYYKDDWKQVDASPGVIHGWLQYPMVTNGFKFDLRVTPVVTGKAASLKFDLSGISLLGWNSDGSARTSNSETSTKVQLAYGAQDFVIGGIRKSESVRSTSGLPFFKDLPVIGRAFSTESESIKQSQLVLIARVEYSQPDSFADNAIREDLGKIVKGVNKGMSSRVGNMFFQQYLLDDDREPRNERLDAVGNIINDEFQTER